MILCGLAAGPIISAAEVEMHSAAENLSDAIKRSSRIQQRDQDFILPIRSGTYLLPPNQYRSYSIGYVSATLKTPTAIMKSINPDRRIKYFISTDRIFPTYFHI